jgi:AcrR family transcriptional regulator
MTGLRERQKLARKQRILEAATELFRRDGYDKTRIEDIAEVAEVSTRTTYNYYQTKADILIAAVSMEVEETLSAGAKIVEAPPASVADALNALTTLYYEHSLVYLSKEMWRMAMAFSIQRPQTPFSKRYTELDRRICLQVASMIQALQVNGKVKTDINYTAMAEVIFNNLNMMFIEFVKCEEMTINELKDAVTKQVTPLALLITTKTRLS